MNRKKISQKTILRNQVAAMSRLVLVFLVVVCMSAVMAFAPASRTGRTARSALQMTSMGRRPLMGGNWKLNPTSVAGAVNLATEVAKLTVGVTDVDIAIFPPHPFLVPVYSKIEATNVKLGGQNCYFMNEGAYTGAVSTCMLKDIGVTYVLAGHSERRTLFQEIDGAINKKARRHPLLPSTIAAPPRAHQFSAPSHRVAGEEDPEGGPEARAVRRRDPGGVRGGPQPRGTAIPS